MKIVQVHLIIGLRHLIQNKLFSIGAQLEKDRCKHVEMRELNDTEKFTS